ncbi:MAG: hypothetical protein IT368_09695 [Candidatus Hydrogenedentes bacterium]|nr:hypothetical protein [Candidatus Hydrogenedentota bacterium]
MSDTAHPGYARIPAQLLRGFFFVCGVAAIFIALALLGDAPAIWPLVSIFFAQVFLMSLGTCTLLRLNRLPSVVLPRLFIVNAAVASLCLCELAAIFVATSEFMSAGGFSRDAITGVSQVSSMIAAFGTAILIYRISLPVGWSHAAVFALAIGCIALVSGAVLGFAAILLAAGTVGRGISQVMDVFEPVIAWLS